MKPNHLLAACISLLRAVACIEVNGDSMTLMVLKLFPQFFNALKDRNMGAPILKEKACNTDYAIAQDS